MQRFSLELCRAKIRHSYLCEEPILPKVGQDTESHEVGLRLSLES